MIRKLNAPVPAHETCTSVMVFDPHEAQRLMAERAANGHDRYDEVWEGVYVMNPLADNEHQDLVTELGTVFCIAITWQGLGKVFAGVNVSDRIDGWTFNYRGPDVVVVLNNSRARDMQTHYVGGPDFLVEVLSPGDRSRKKLPFYEQLGVRELLLVGRDPWKLELFRLQEGHLKRVGNSTPKRSTRLESTVLPLTFRLVAGAARPQIAVAHHDEVQNWLV